MTKKKSVKNKRINGGNIKRSMLRRLAADIEFLLNNADVTRLLLLNDVDVDVDRRIIGANIAKYRFFKTGTGIGITTFLLVTYKEYTIKIYYPDDFPHVKNDLFITPPVGDTIDYIQGNTWWDNLVIGSFRNNMVVVFLAIDKAIENDNNLQYIIDSKSETPVPIAHAFFSPVASPVDPDDPDGGLVVYADSELAREWELPRAAHLPGGGRRVKKHKTKKRKYSRRRK